MLSQIFLQQPERGSCLRAVERKNERAKSAYVRGIYFFFAGAFFSSFFAGFLATSLTSGIYICTEYVFIIF
jgi:hypothetical protein